MILINIFFITLVASYLPPKPVSNNTISAGNFENAKNAATVVASKKVKSNPSDFNLHYSITSYNCSSSISLPEITIRSLNLIRCGEVY